MKCLVTGGAGFIGSHLVDKLISQGHLVTVIDNLSTGNSGNVNPKAEFHITDLVEFETMALFNNIDVVFHLAALPRIQRSLDEPEHTFLHNVYATHRVLERARAAGVKRVIYSSSSSIYGEKDFLIDEQVPADPRTLYATHKLMGELLCQQYSKHFGLETVCLRYFNVYGPRASLEGAYKLVIGKFIEQKNDNEALTIYGDGTQTRDFTHVTDVVAANIACMKYKKKCYAEAFNVCTGIETSINRIAEIIGGQSVHVENPRAAYDEQSKRGSYDKLSEMMGWKPKVSIEAGIAELL